eukprot:Phypoly_transcript_23194.p1 GENE.Phypoly_transcript_23194~~Phypoly_transcript_23194.p1  ORF type:complete len:163 (-),score=37.04 Phypoly_transcript_23194:58-546(-)
MADRHRNRHARGAERRAYLSIFSSPPCPFLSLFSFSFSFSFSSFFPNPFAQTIEQQLNARRVAVLGAGIDTREAQNVACKVLTDGVARLLAEKSFSENAKKIGESFASAGGVQPAIDALEEIPHYYAKEKLSNSPATARLQNTLRGLKRKDSSSTGWPTLVI